MALLLKDCRNYIKITQNKYNIILYIIFFILHVRVIEQINIKTILNCFLFPHLYYNFPWKIDHVHSGTLIMFIFKGK